MGAKGEKQVKPDLQDKLRDLKQTLQMLDETRVVRAKYGHGDEDDTGQEMSMLRIQLYNLEKEVYGSSVAAMKVRAASLERAINAPEGEV